MLLKLSCDLIHTYECNFGFNLSYIYAINDSKCLEKEPLKFREFRAEKLEKKSCHALGERGWTLG